MCEEGGADQHGYHPMAPGTGHGLPISGTSKPPHRLPLCKAEGADLHGFYPMAPGPGRGLPISGTSKPGSYERGLPNIGTSPFLGFSPHTPVRVTMPQRKRGRGNAAPAAPYVAATTPDSSVAASLPIQVYPGSLPTTPHSSERLPRFNLRGTLSK